MPGKASRLSRLDLRLKKEGKKAGWGARVLANGILRSFS